MAALIQHVCTELQPRLRLITETCRTHNSNANTNYNMASSQISADQGLAIKSPMLILEKDRSRYRIATMRVLATNNPTGSCLFNYGSTPAIYTPSKKIFTVRNHEFSEVYENKIHNNIVETLLSSLHREYQWRLHVLRMGFENDQMANPIVVHLLVPHGCLSDSIALLLLRQITAIISAAQWETEQVYMDICQAAPCSDLRSEEIMSEGVDLSESFADFYNYNPPLPGFSIGPKDIQSCAGSFSGFIKHEDNIYGLACEHVVNGHFSTVLGCRGPYKYEDGKQKFMVTLPAIQDHKATKKAISTRFEDAILLEREAKSRARLGPVLSSFWGTANQQANDHNVDFGYVYATSGRDKSQKFYNGSLDWAIISCSLSDVRNKHPEYNGIDQGSGFQLRDVSARRFVNNQLGSHFVEDTKEYFRKGRNFKPIRESTPEPDEIFFKLPSRTSGWREAQYNEVMATQNKDGRGVTRELCFVTHDPVGHVTKGGDSGAPLIDKNYRPVAILWGGAIPEDRFKDVTYGTPLRVILRDIERRLDWQEGSVSYC